MLFKLHHQRLTDVNKDIDERNASNTAMQCFQNLNRANHTVFIAKAIAFDTALAVGVIIDIYR